MSSNLACHSAGLSVHDILTDIELDSPAGHLATPKHVCLLRSFLTQILIRKHWTANFTTKEKITKIRPWSGRGQWRDQTTRWRTLLLSFAFFFPYQTAAELCTFDITFLNLEGWICARGEVIRDEWWWLLMVKKWGMFCSYISKEMILRTFPDILIERRLIAFASSCRFGLLGLSFTSLRSDVWSFHSNRVGTRLIYCPTAECLTSAGCSQIHVRSGIFQSSKVSTFAMCYVGKCAVVVK